MNKHEIINPPPAPLKYSEAERDFCLQLFSRCRHVSAPLIKKYGFSHEQIEILIKQYNFKWCHEGQTRRMERIIKAQMAGETHPFEPHHISSASETETLHHE